MAWNIVPESEVDSGETRGHLSRTLAEGRTWRKRVTRRRDASDHLVKVSENLTPHDRAGPRGAASMKPPDPELAESFDEGWTTVQHSRPKADPRSKRGARGGRGSNAPRQHPSQPTIRASRGPTTREARPLPQQSQKLPPQDQPTQASAQPSTGTATQQGPNQVPSVPQVPSPEAIDHEFCLGKDAEEEPTEIPAQL